MLDKKTENKPSTYKSITVIIRILDAKTDKVESQKIKIIDGADRREWLKDQLAKDVMWAMLNGKYVEVINKQDDEG